MSTNMTLFENMPDDYKELLAQLQPEQNTGGSGNGGIKRLSIRGGVFRKVVNGKEIAELEDRSIKAIIVKTAPISREYYQGQFVAGQNNPPTCWSADTNTGTPSEDVVVTDRQSATCFDCKQNIKGSGQGESRACRFKQRIAVLLADQDGTVRSKELYLLNLPATSLFGNEGKKMGLQAYAKLLAGQGAMVASIVTEIRFDTDSSTPKLLFKPERPISKEELELVIETQKNPETDKLVALTVKPKEDTGTEQLTNGKVASPPPISEETKEQKAKADEPVEEPTVKKAKKSKDTPPEKADLASLLDEFDD